MIIVLRDIRAGGGIEIQWGILQQGGGCQVASLDRHLIEERFERGASLARCLNAIYVPRARSATGGAYVSQHFSGRVIDDQRRAVTYILREQFSQVTAQGIAREPLSVSVQ